MMNEIFWGCCAAICINLSGFIYMISLVDRWRYSPKTTKRILIPCFFLIQGIIVSSYFFLADIDAANLLWTLLHTLSLGLTLVAAPWRSGRLLFVLSIAYMLTSTSNILSHMVFPSYCLHNLLLQTAVNALLTLWVLHRFRPQLHSIFRWGNSSVWYLLSLIPLVYNILIFIEVMDFFSDSVPVNTHQTAVTFTTLNAASGSFLVLVMSFCIYTAFEHFFRVLNDHYLMQKNNAMLDARITSMRRNSNNDRKRKEQRQRFCSDLNGFLNDIEDFLARRDTDRAVETLHQIDDLLISDHQKNAPRQYTGSIILDAVIADYEEQALLCKIQLQYHFATLILENTDTTGLAVVLSNALENAINACSALPPETSRWIHISLWGTSQQSILEIRNPYSREPLFDLLSGCPRSTQDGHGYGTRSMKSFAEENHAELQFIAADGIFSMSLMF